jgi:hypothetical protein
MMPKSCGLFGEGHANKKSNRKRHEQFFWECRQSVRRYHEHDGQRLVVCLLHHRCVPPPRKLAGQLASQADPKDYGQRQGGGGGRARHHDKRTAEGLAAPSSPHPRRPPKSPSRRVVRRSVFLARILRGKTHPSNGGRKAYLNFELRTRRRRAVLWRKRHKLFNEPRPSDSERGQ